MAVTLEIAKAHLNITTTDDDTLVTRLVAAAKDFLCAQTGRSDLFVFQPSNELDQALLLLVGHWYANREASTVGVSASELPLGVCDIINNNRTWAWS